MLRKLLRGPLPVMKGRQKTYVEGPVDYTDLRTEFIGLIYEGLLDYRIKRTDDEIGPQVFLNIGREPVLPLRRLEAMLAEDEKGLKNLLTTLGKEKATATVATEEATDSDEDAEASAEDQDEASEEEQEPDTETESEAVERHGGDYADAAEAARRWARQAIVVAGLVGKQKKSEPDSRVPGPARGRGANRLIKRVVATGEFYLVRAGNTRKGTGTFYTRPQLAVPTVHRTLEPLCYDKGRGRHAHSQEAGRNPLLKVCDPACGSASFLVAGLHYLTDALTVPSAITAAWTTPTVGEHALRRPRGLSPQPRAKHSTRSSSRSRPMTRTGDNFEAWVKARLRRHVVERCIYGVDINPLAVELARVSLWVATLDPDLPFSFLDHKIKVGNALVGCWLDRVEDYPLRAWEREGGDGKKGERTGRIETFLKGEKVGNRRRGDGPIKQEMRRIDRGRYRNPGRRSSAG